MLTNDWQRQSVLLPAAQDPGRRSPRGGGHPGRASPRGAVAVNPGSINAYLDCAPRISSLETGAGPSWVRTIIGYMMAHLHQPLSIALLSQVAGLSTSHFSTLFKRATGYSPIDFFIRAKMSFARELLSGTTLQVKEIAGMLGYDDPLYFSRRFKKVNGSAPKCFRTRSIRSFSPSER